jgi:crossover junction endodeoxyribonuclease RuvC
MSLKQKYRLLGVDPGSNILGYAVVEVNGSELSLLDLGVITMHKLEEQQLKLKKIFEELQTIIHRYRPSEMAIEAPFYGKNVQSMLKLGRAQGVAIAAAITKDVGITEYSPKKIKQAITGNGNASKEQVAAMLETILHRKLEEKYLDATDALATAVCHFFQSKTQLAGGKQFRDWSSFLKENPTRLA